MKIYQVIQGGKIIMSEFSFLDTMVNQLRSPIFRG